MGAVLDRDGTDSGERLNLAGENMLHWLSHRLRAVVRRGRVEAELNEELRYHLEREIERLVAGGMPLREAADAAARDFGNVESFKEESRDAWGTRGWNDLVADVRYAALTDENGLLSAQFGFSDCFTSKFEPPWINAGRVTFSSDVPSSPS